MIWQNPWAWIGLAAIAVPILVHLLGRDRAPRHSFPTLRFLEAPELPPTRRTHIHDVLLLVLRLCIVGAAVGALAQPLVLVASRKRSLDGRLARAIIVDTSASMRRLTPAGEAAVDAAKREAKRLAGEARTSVVVETSAPARAVAGAAAWLASQASRRELVVVSDFQAGEIEGADFAAVPSAVGIRGVEIGVRASDKLIRRRLRAGTGEITEQIDVSGEATIVGWSKASASDTAHASFDASALIVDSRDQSAVAAVTTAAQTIGVELPLDTSVVIRIVYPDAPDRAELSARAHGVSSARLIELLAPLRGDSLLQLTAAQDSTDGRERLLLFPSDDAASLRSASLIASARQALSIATPTSELEPTTITNSVIASWQRPSSLTNSRDTVDASTGPSDGRWLWVLVLALLAMEAWMRREPHVAAARAEEQINDRAA